MGNEKEKRIDGRLLVWAMKCFSFACHLFPSSTHEWKSWNRVIFLYLCRCVCVCKCLTPTAISSFHLSLHLHFEHTTFYSVFFSSFIFTYTPLTTKRQSFEVDISTVPSRNWQYYRTAVDFTLSKFKYFICLYVSVLALCYHDAIHLLSKQKNNEREKYANMRFRWRIVVVINERKFK